MMLELRAEKPKRALGVDSQSRLSSQPVGGSRQVWRHGLICCEVVVTAPAPCVTDNAPAAPRDIDGCVDWGKKLDMQVKGGGAGSTAPLEQDGA
jgi:hypothetical protein